MTRVRDDMLIPSPERPRFLSEAACQEVAGRLARFSTGGGYTTTAIASTWRGNTRWARNQISTSGEVRDTHIVVNRTIRGAWETHEEINEVTDEALLAAVRRAERLLQFRQERAESEYKALRYDLVPITAAPNLYFEATYQLDAARRAEAAHELTRTASAAGMFSAGYIEVSAHSMALISSTGWSRYFQWTWARHSVTVRDPAGTGSGWAGIDWPDWRRIDSLSLSKIALDKCLTSRNAVAIEPGRYTTILEPQAVSDFLVTIKDAFDRFGNEVSNDALFNKSRGTENGLDGFARIGERVMDERITIRFDPTDPDLATVPFEFVVDDDGGDGLVVPPEVHLHAATPIANGIYTGQMYERSYAVAMLGRSTAMGGGGLRMSVQGATVSPAEMIATTKRGVLVTRFDSVIRVGPPKASLCRGYTRDGFWLIENGKISHPVKNMVFTESVLAALNNVEQLGVPQRTFNPPGYNLNATPFPVIVPPLKLRDFSFTALADSV